MVSLVLHARRADADTVAAAIDSIHGAGVHASDGEGRFVVLLEAEDETRIPAAIGRLQQLAGVLSVALVYHEVDEA